MEDGVSRETSTDGLLRVYRELVLKWNKRVALVSRSTPEESLERLIRHALEAVRVLPEHIQSVVDVGSGAGLPGIPIAVSRPDCAVRLVERSQNKAYFLAAAVRELKVGNVEIVGASFRLAHLDMPRPLAITSLGVGEYRLLTQEVWPELRSGDGLLYFIPRAVAAVIAADVSRETWQWERLPGNTTAGIFWLEKV
jgi:16S rRNA (guanine(527)-N(7))-methyltransferase RsmG